MEDLVKKFEEIAKKLDIETKRRRVAALEKEVANESLWKDWEKGQRLSKELADLKKEIGEFHTIRSLVEGQSSSKHYCPERAKKLKKLIRDLEIKTFLNGKYDKGNAYFTIKAGQGGTDAMDWVEMLSRMYQRYFDKKGWVTKCLSSTKGEEAGLKNVSFHVVGDYVYGFLKGEIGVHRLVRLSPFNAANLRQTSFASVEVIPEIENISDVDIDPADLKVDTFRSSGPGGQNVNKVETAVRVRHLPSGITVTCQAERSQSRNKDRAISMLKSKLVALERERRKETIKGLKGDYRPASWGNQIRSYILHPYKLVKDLRTGVESSNPDLVLGGDLDEFIEAEVGI